MAVQILTVAKMFGLTSVPVLRGNEGASETFVEGSVLLPGAGGAEDNIQEAATEPVDNILGIANQAASTVTDTVIEFIPALPGIIFEGNIGTSATAGDIAADDLFSVYPLNLTGTDWFIDKTDNTNPCVRIVGFKDPVGTTNGRVYFVFLTDTLAWAN